MNAETQAAIDRLHKDAQLIDIAEFNHTTISFSDIILILAEFDRLKAHKERKPMTEGEKEALWETATSKRNRLSRISFIDGLESAEDFHHIGEEP